jgi:hypothetical protein
MICLGQAIDQRVMTRLLQQFVNAESTKKRGQLYLDSVLRPLLPGTPIAIILLLVLSRRKTVGRKVKDDDGAYRIMSTHTLN